MIAKGKPMKNANPDTTTLTLRDTPYTLIQTAKRITGKATGSQAFLAGIGKLDELTDQVADQREEIRRLQQPVAALGRELIAILSPGLDPRS